MNGCCLRPLISFVNAVVRKISQYNCHFIFRPQYDVVFNYKTIRKFKITDLLCCVHIIFFSLYAFGANLILPTLLVHFIQLALSHLPNTVIPRLTSDPANEFFG